MDPSSKVVYLSLQRHLLNAALHESPAAVGTVFVDARVRRVEPGFGVLLELPGGVGKGQPSAGFAHVSNLTDDRLEKVEKVGLMESDTEYAICVRFRTTCKNAQPFTYLSIE